MPIRGNAGWKYTPPGGSLTTVQMNAPLQDVTPSARVRAYAWDSEDFTEREVVTTGTGVREISARIPLHEDADELLEMLRHGVSGVVLSYFPDLGIGENYPCVLTEPADVPTLSRDQPAPYGFWTGTVRLRHASGGDFGGILVRRNDP